MVENPRKKYHIYIMFDNITEELIILSMRFFPSVLMVVFITSCVTPEQGPPSMPERPSRPAVSRNQVLSRDLPRDEQNRMAIEVFKEMYELEKSTPREDIPSAMIEGYLRIIREYPRSALAEEGHWKVIKMYLRNFNPPKRKEAEELYERFLGNYPDSVILPQAQIELLQFYGRQRMWREILILSASITRSNRDKPPLLPLFYYAEANYQLDRKDEAARAFELVAERIPRNSSLTPRTKERLEELMPEKTFPQWQEAKTAGALRGQTVSGGTIGGKTVGSHSGNSSSRHRLRPGVSQRGVGKRPAGAGPGKPIRRGPIPASTAPPSASTPLKGKTVSGTTLR